MHKGSREESLKRAFKGKYKPLGKWGMYRVGTNYAIIDTGGVFEVVKKSTLGCRNNIIMRTEHYDNFGSLESAMSYIEKRVKK